MKLTVLGAGAIGSMLGGLVRFHHPAAEVVMIGRGGHGAALCEQQAVRLEGPWGERQVPVRASTEHAELEGSDFVLLTVKSQATEEAIRGALPYLGDAVVISIQNGINDEILARHVRKDRLVMGMTATNMAITTAGCVSLQLSGTTLVGPDPAGGNRQAAERAVQLLRRTGLPVSSHHDVLGARYTKLAINALGYASCLSASNFIGEALADAQWRRYVGRPILDECIATFRLAGIRPARIPGTPTLSGLRQIMRLFDAPLVGGIAIQRARRRYDRRPILFSLYQDLLRGKSTEVDFINGQIVRLAESVGNTAPRNAKVASMVHELERQPAGTFRSREQVIQAFRELEPT